MPSPAGLKSRITRLWEFKDWTVQDCADHFTSLLESEGFKLGEGVVKELKCLCTELIALPGNFMAFQQVFSFTSN
jgi:hypothetical protein